MKASLRLLAALSCLSLSSANAAPKKPSLPQTDPHIEREFRRMLNAYEKIGDFSVTSLDTVYRGSEIVRLRSTGRFATDGRMALKVEEIKGAGTPGKLQLARLFDGTELIETVGGRPETRMARAQLTKSPAPLKQFFMPSYGLRALSIMLQTKKAHLAPPRPDSAPLVMRDLGQGRLQIESRNRLKSDDTAYDVVFLFAIGKEGFMERMETRIAEPGKKPVPYEIAHLSRPIPLKTPEAFSWKSFAPPLSPDFSIAPDALTAFERAAKFYSGLKSLSTGLKIEMREGNSKTLNSGHLDWERRGLLRLHNATKNQLLLIDGTHVWTVNDEDTNVRLLAKGPKSQVVLKELANTFGGFDDGSVTYMAQLLNGDMPVLSYLEEYSQVKATLKTDAVLDGAACDIAQIDLITTPIGSLVKAFRIEYEFWFARDNGRLLRIISKTSGHDGEDTYSDARLESQHFDIAFAPQTWKRTPVVAGK